jgi:hypothetical protein
MQTIGGFLERYKNFMTPPLAAARAVQRAVADTLGITIKEDAIQVKNGRADITTSSLEKTEILLNKEKILAHARASIGDSVREIR